MYCHQNGEEARANSVDHRKANFASRSFYRNCHVLEESFRRFSLPGMRDDDDVAASKQHVSATRCRLLPPIYASFQDALIHRQWSPKNGRSKIRRQVASKQDIESRQLLGIS